MGGGTKSLLFGCHQVFLHPVTVFLAWIVLYRKLPKPHQMMAILIHDLGLWGMPDVDGEEAETHPKVMHDWCMGVATRGKYNGKWRTFWVDTALEILGHSRFYARRAHIELSRLYRADKLAINFYPASVYLLLGWLSGEIAEYRRHYEDGKYTAERKSHGDMTVFTWFLEARAGMTHQGITGKAFDNAFTPKSVLEEVRNRMCDLENRRMEMGTVHHYHALSEMATWIEAQLWKSENGKVPQL